MQFEYTWMKIYERRKTQTARLPHGVNLAVDKWGTPWATDGLENYPLHDVRVVTTENGHLLYEVGNSYAVQPFRASPAIYVHPEFGYTPYPLSIASKADDTKYDRLTPAARKALARMGWHELRIKIKDIRWQDVRTYAEADVRAEGFDGLWQFLQTWIFINDRAARWSFDPDKADYWLQDGNKRELVSWERVEQKVMARPDKFYKAWILSFEVDKKP